MKTKNIEEKLLKTVERFLLNNGTVGVKRKDWPDILKQKPLTTGAMFKKDLGMDSLDSIELLLEIEEEYEVILDAHKFKDLLTLRDAIDFFIKTNGEDAFTKKQKKDEPTTRKRPKKRGSKVPNPTAGTKNPRRPPK